MAETLTPFTFKDSGVTVQIRKVSPLLSNELRKIMPAPAAPTAPLNTVDYGDGKPVQEPNPSDPGYLAALAAYNTQMDAYNEQLEAATRRLYIKRGVECDVPADQVAELRAEMQDLGATLDPDDKVVYITYIAVGTLEDYQDLIAAITRRSQPTEVAVSETNATFPAAVQGV